MEGYSIHFEEGIDSETKKIAEEYWEIENGEFVNTVSYFFYIFRSIPTHF
jgi:hypothetical protein